MLTGLVFATTAALLVPSAPGSSRSGAKDQRTPAVRGPVQILAQGKALCAQGNHAKGIDRIFDAGVQGQKLPARQRRRLAWRRAAKRCFLSWVKKLSACQADPSVAHNLRTLDALAAKAVKVAMPAVVRKAKAARKRCLAELPKRLEKKCRDEPGAKSNAIVGKVARALGPVAKTIANGLDKAKQACGEQWRSNLELRCKVHPDMSTAKEAAALVPAVPKALKEKAKATYEQCIRAMADRGLALCRSGKFLAGRKFVQEALGRFGFYGAKDPPYLEKVERRMKSHCGRFLVRLKGSVVARTGRIRMKLTLKGGLVLTGDKNLTGSFVLESKPVWAKAGKDRVQVRTQTCRARIGGKYNPKTHNLAWWPKQKLACSESIQVASPNGTARVVRETILADMAKAARLLKTWMPGTDGSKLGLNMSGPIGGGRSVRLQGSYELNVIEK